MDNSFCSLWKELFKKRREFINKCDMLGLDPNKVELEIMTARIEDKLVQVEKETIEEVKLSEEIKQIIMEIEHERRQS